MSPWEDLKRELTRLGMEFEESNGPTVLSLEVGRFPFLIEFHPDGRLVVLFGVDMDELRTLVSGGATEDLSEDELQRVARDQLRPTVNVFKSTLKGDGFQETIDAGAGYYAIAFNKTIPEQGARESAALIRTCVERLGAAKPR